MLCGDRARGIEDFIPIEHISDHLEFCFSGCDLLGRCGALDPPETEHGHREEFEGMANEDSRFGKRLIRVPTVS